MSQKNNNINVLKSQSISMSISQNSAKTVLLVEDDVSITFLYKTKLESNNFVVITAVNGLDALKKAVNYNLDVVLLDLKMPIMSGEEFLYKFRKIQKFSETPVIVLTNLGREEAPKTLWHYGISGYFVKAHNTPSDLVNILVKEME